MESTNDDRSRAGDLLGAIAIAALVWVVAVSPVRRPQGGDTVPGRLAMATLACNGTSDLASVQWLATRAARGSAGYYIQLTDDSRGIVSAFGPGPGWLGWPFFRDVRPGSTIDDAFLQHRARFAAATSVAAATLIAALGLLRVVRARWALAAAATAGLSFAGVATLAQGLWQQTAALPFFVLGVSLGLACERTPRLAVVASASIALGAWLRPADAPLALGIACFAFARVPRERRTPELLAAALLAALAASLVVIAWDAWYLDAVLPTGQLVANRRMHEGDLFVLAPRHVLTATIGLLVSPGRGIAWYAPFVPCAVAIGALAARRATAGRWLLLGVLAQFAVACMFYRWWGGVGFGPRLLASVTWTAAILPFVDGAPDARAIRALLAVSMGLTVVVGVLGAVSYDSRRVEVPLDPDRNPARLFGSSAAVWNEIAAPPPIPGTLRDAPNGPFVYCDPVGLRDARGDRSP